MKSFICVLLLVAAVCAEDERVARSLIGGIGVAPVGLGVPVAPIGLGVPIAPLGLGAHRLGRSIVPGLGLGAPLIGAHGLGAPLGVHRVGRSIVGVPAVGLAHGVAIGAPLIAPIGLGIHG